MAAYNGHDIEIAVRKFGMLRFFPPDPSVRAEIAAFLTDIVPSKEALEWLVDAMVNRVGEWRGPAELRVVLCWRYLPLDGKPATDSQISGFRPSDGERLYEATYIEHAKPLELDPLDERKRLAAPVSEDTGLQAMVTRIAAGKGMK